MVYQSESTDITKSMDTQLVITMSKFFNNHKHAHSGTICNMVWKGNGNYQEDVLTPELAYYAKNVKGKVLCAIEDAKWKFEKLV